MGRALSLCLLAFVGCTDREPPRWEPGARLVLEPLGPDRASVRWPAAQDVTGVTRYRLRVDGERHSEHAQAGSEMLDRLAPGRSYEVWVVAYDRASNASEPLIGEIELVDVDAPRFEPGAELSLRLGPPGNSGERPVRLTWPAATDDVEVLGYEVLVDSEPLTRTPERATSFLRALDGAEVFEVRAHDAADNQSAGLFALATTPEVPRTEGGWLASEDTARGSFAVRLSELRRLEGERDPGPVERRLRLRLLSAGGCYRRALESGPLFDGHLTLELRVRPEGSVEEVNVVGAGLGRPTLATCLRSVVGRETFVPDAGGRFRVRYDFALR